MIWAPWLVHPAGIRRGLDRVRDAGLSPVPNEWQIGLGILRMWHRLLFRSNTVGTSSDPVRPTWRARLLHNRTLRLPFLLAERAVAPLDHSGLLQGPDRLIRHLIAAHHDRNQALYDLEILALYPGALAELVDRVAAVVDGSDPRADWLQDLVVFEGYHASLLAAARAARDGGYHLDRSDDPDISFRAFLAWCADQPPTLGATLRRYLPHIGPEHRQAPKGGPS